MAARGRWLASVVSSLTDSWLRSVVSFFIFLLPFLK
jgi:hypothetical protein